MKTALLKSIYVCVEKHNVFSQHRNPTKGHTRLASLFMLVVVICLTCSIAKSNQKVIHIFVVIYFRQFNGNALH